MNINIHLGDNKDCTVSIDTTPEWHLEIQLIHIVNYCHNLGYNFYISMCYSMKNIRFENIIICYEGYYNICTFVKEIEQINYLIHYMQNNIDSMHVLSGDVYWDQNDWWIHSSRSQYSIKNSFTIWLCDKSKKQFIKQLKGLVYVMKTLEQKQVINKCIIAK